MSVFISLLLTCSPYLPLYLSFYLSICYLSSFVYILLPVINNLLNLYILYIYMYNYMYLYHFVYHLIQLQRYTYLKIEQVQQIHKHISDIFVECQFRNLFSGDSCVWSNYRAYNCLLMLWPFLFTSSFLYLSVHL